VREGNTRLGQKLVTRRKKRKGVDLGAWELGEAIVVSPVAARVKLGVS